MNRRDLLKTATGAATAVLFPVTLRAQESGTPQTESFAELTITITDTGFELPETLTAGRYAVSVVNRGSGPSHSSLGRIPDGTTFEEVNAFLSTESDELPEWFIKTGYVGLPDWPQPGETRTGIVDLQAGNYFMFDPFSTRLATLTISGDGDFSNEPDADLRVDMHEMEFVLPAEGLRTGPVRLKVTNSGALPHEFQVLAVPGGTTVEQILALFSLPEDATPPPGDALAEALGNYAPAAATSILGAQLTSWIDIDLSPGTYALLCALPIPSDVPHAMQGMIDIVTLS